MPFYACFLTSYRLELELPKCGTALYALLVRTLFPAVCAQLSRKVEERQGHRPLLSDLRESGSIEQDCDIALLIFRREYYDERDHPGLAEIIIAKNRHGATGTVKLTYRKEVAQFVNFSPIDALVEPSHGNSKINF